MNKKVYEVIIGSGTYYTEANNIQEGLDKAREWSKDMCSDNTVKSIMCIAVIDF